MARSAENLFHEFSANATADVAMSLLRANDAVLHLALMAAHLGDGEMIDGLTLAALIGDDLLDLRAVVSAETSDQAFAEPAAFQLYADFEQALYATL